ncbi:MAG: hypothetical protein AAFY47_03895 [Pseudomonadota bacterium]
MIGSGIAVAALWMSTVTLLIFGAVNVGYQKYVMGTLAILLGVSGGIVGMSATEALLDAERAIPVESSQIHQET